MAFVFHNVFSVLYIFFDLCCKLYQMEIENIICRTQVRFHQVRVEQYRWIGMDLGNVY